MIHGIGTDVVSIPRMREVYSRHSDKLVKRILSAREYLEFTQMSDTRGVEFLAGRFAVKEAMAKASGLGLGRLGMNRVDIERTEQGLSTRFLAMDVPLGFLRGRWHVSISHSADVAFAMAVWEDSP